MTSTRSGLPVFVPTPQKQQKWGYNKRGWYIRLPQELPHERRIIELETRVANLEAALAKMEESK